MCLSLQVPSHPPSVSMKPIFLAPLAAPGGFLEAASQVKADDNIKYLVTNRSLNSARGKTILKG